VRRSSLLTIVFLAAFGLVALPSRADAQLLKKLKDAAQDAVEDEAANQTERLLREAIRCAVNDPVCAKQAEEDDQPVIYTDQNGEVITDDEGTPITDRDDAATRAGVAPGDDAGAPKPGEGAWANYDFVPGEQVLFFDDFTDDEAGDFPRRLEWLRGNMELVEWQDRVLLRSTGDGSQFAVLLPEGVPERFTLEFDISDAGMSNGTIVILGEGQDNLRDRWKAPRFAFGHWRGSGIWRDREPLSTLDDDRIRTEIVTARVMADGEHVKVFINEKRISNVPRIEIPRGDRITFEMWGTDEKPVYLGNIRVAAGGRDLYDDLIESGRVATQGIFFDVDSDRIQPESTPTLEEIGTMLEEHPDLGIAIEGHTDSTGNDDHNLDLSIRRAVAVREYLIGAYGIAANRLEADGFGETRPVGDNETPEGRQQNRRVELVVLD
jgi:outer membrane protein OmpA-like peptidoglycan-associated protein